MAKVDLTALSLKELRVIEQELPGVIADKVKADKDAIRAKLADMARASGFSLEELLGGKAVRRAGQKVAVKYRNPDNTSETWSGRGRMARWLKDKLAKRGTKIEDFEV